MLIRFNVVHVQIVFYQRIYCTQTTLIQILCPSKTKLLEIRNLYEFPNSAGSVCGSTSQ